MSNEVMWKFVANIMRAELARITKFEEEHGRMEYTKGMRASVHKMMLALAEHMHNEGMVGRNQFLREALGIKKEAVPA